MVPCQVIRDGQRAAPVKLSLAPEPQPAHVSARQAAVTIRLMADDPIPVTRSVSIPRDEVELRFSRSSGPGGQHAQKSDTRVEAVFDVDASSALSEAQKRRVVAKAGPVLRAVAQDERSQWRNRELALERLAETLREALRVERPRRATKPTRSAVEKRLDQKRRRGETKRLRRPPD
jgi:ribosome-associated protein